MILKIQEISYTSLKTDCEIFSTLPSSRQWIVAYIRWHLTPVLLPRKSHGGRSLVGCSPWGREESDTTEILHFHFSLSCIGEGNGNPLQCSYLGNLPVHHVQWAIKNYKANEKQKTQCEEAEQASETDMVGMLLLLLLSHFSHVRLCVTL